MPTPLELLETQALQLPPQERARLAERLWNSVHGTDEVDAAWEAELHRRAEQIDRDEVVCRPWDDVMAELRTKYG